MIQMKQNYILSAIRTILLFAAILLLGCQGQTPNGQRSIRSLTPQNVTDVRDQFNAAKDDVRLLILLSPT